jgi:preprotein translocase subunit YajC
LQKTRLLILGIIPALLATLVFVGGCSLINTPTTDTDGSTSTTSTWTSLLPMIGFIVVLFALMYFFTIRPQQKKKQESQKMLQALQQGDKVITNAGIYGKIDRVYEDSFLLKVDSGDTMRVAKWAVVGKQPEETVKTG